MLKVPCLLLFNKSFTGHVLTFCTECWEGQHFIYKMRTKWVAKIGGKITGKPVSSISVMTEQYTSKLTTAPRLV